MWIIYLLLFIAGGFIAWLIGSVADVLTYRNEYTDDEFSYAVRSRLAGVMFLAIIASTLITAAASLVLDDAFKGVKEETQSLERRIEKLELLNQVDTAFIQQLINEEDLK